MPLEPDVDYPGDLDPNSPGPAEFISEGDDHLRNLKKAFRNAFPGATGPVLVMGAATGPADVYVLTPARPLLDYVANMLVAIKIPAANTAPAPTLNISSLGPKTIKAVDGDPLAPGDLPANSYQLMLYNGTDLLLLAPTQGFVDRMDTALRGYTDAEVAELKAYVDQLVFADALPNQSGKRGKFIATSGTDADWYNVMPTITVYEVSTTWVADVPRIRVTVVGGGGSSAALGQTNAYTGGAGGGTAIKVLDVVIGVTYTITVGAGGASVTAPEGGSTPGNAGGTSSFSGPGIATVSATGGGGGVISGSASDPGGIGSGGDINLRGSRSHKTVTNGSYSVGGDSYLGKGAPWNSNAEAWGAGAGGSNGSFTGENGGFAGYHGVVIIEKVLAGA